MPHPTWPPPVSITTVLVEALIAWLSIAAFAALVSGVVIVDAVDQLGPIADRLKRHVMTSLADMGCVDGEGE